VPQFKAKVRTVPGGAMNKPQQIRVRMGGQ
jgi:hypothetical protein